MRWNGRHQLRRANLRNIDVIGGLEQHARLMVVPVLDIMPREGAVDAFLASRNAVRRSGGVSVGVVGQRQAPRP